MALGSILDGLKEKTMSGERMNPNQPQFELYWREQISKEIGLYALINHHLMSEETSEVLNELREYVRAVTC
jgi:hypothetical protein